MTRETRRLGPRPCPTRLRLALAALFLAAAAVPLGAQETSRKGFWFAAGMGVGQKLSDDAIVGGSWAGHMRAGGTLSPQLLLGGEVLWVLGADAYGSDIPVGRAGLLCTLLAYPWRSAGLFLKGGVGYTQMDEAMALAANAGLGLDIPLSGNFYLTPDLGLLFVTGDAGSVSHVAFTVGVTWH